MCVKRALYALKKTQYIPKRALYVQKRALYNLKNDLKHQEFEHAVDGFDILCENKT